MEGGVINYTPPRPYCRMYPLTVSHILIHGEFFRSRYFGGVRNMGDLFERFSLKHILEFLKKTNLYVEI